MNEMTSARSRTPEDLEDFQSGLYHQTADQLRSTGAEIWADSEPVRLARQDLRVARNELLREASAGSEIIQGLRDSFFRNEASRRQNSERSRTFCTQVVNESVASLQRGLDGLVGHRGFGRQLRAGDEDLLSAYQRQTREIQSTANIALDLHVRGILSQDENLSVERRQQSEEAQLFFDIIERHIHIKEALLRNLCGEYRLECELAVKKVDKAIEYVQLVQRLTCQFMKVAEEQRENESARKIREHQKIEAEKRAMKDLDMTHDEARQAAHLLELKEEHLYALKKEELAMKKCQNQQEHERASKRYLGFWRHIFGW